MISSLKANLKNCLIISFITSFIKACHETREAKFYILMWTNSSQEPFTMMKMGKKSFIENNCAYQNCYLTSHVLHLSDVTYFDAILFNSATLRIDPDLVMPNKRSRNQKYVLVSTESSAKYPIPESYNRFFNWTWTYKLDSDILFTYLVVRDKRGRKIGPKKTMHWMSMDEMAPTSNAISRKLRTKRNAVAWYVTDCDSITLHKNYITRLNSELNKYFFTVDVLGPCGKPCPKGRRSKCFSLIESNYYFYLAFENAISEDYVTDQLLIALNHYSVPVVFGGANYSRFMPPGIYLNALEYDPESLGGKMFEIISNRKSYHNMFKWHNHYSYHDPMESPDTNGICEFCALLNDDRKRKEKKVYRNIVKWLQEHKYLNTSRRNFEFEIVSIDKNRYEKEHGADLFKNDATVNRTKEHPPTCSSVTSCAKNYYNEIKRNILNWFRIQ